MIALRRSIKDRFPHTLLYNIFRFTTIILAALLLYNQIFFAFFDAINFKDAMNAIAAKNVALGQGYSAIFFDKNYPFHFSITSQPLLNFPAALMIMIFGNHYSTLCLTAIFLMWSVIFAIFILTYNFFSRDKRWLFYFLNISLALLFLTNSSDQNPFYFWHRFCGDLTSSLLIILGIILLLKVELNCNKIPFGKIFFSSFILGMSLLAMTSALLSIVIILLSMCLRIFFAKSLTKTEKLKLTFVLCVGAFTPLILFCTIEIIYLGFAQFIKIQAQLLEFYKHNNLLSKNHSETTISILNIKNNLSYLFNIFSYSTIFIIPTTLYLFYLSCRENQSSSSLLCSKISAVLLLCSFASCLYWILFSFGNFNHYLLIAILFLIFALSLLLSNIYYKNIRFSCAIYIMFFLALIFASRLDSASYLIFGKAKNNSLSEYELIAKNLSDLQKEEVTFISCGNNLELEFLLPKSNNFKDCHEAVKVWYRLQKTMLVTHLRNDDTTNFMKAGQYFTLHKKIPAEVSKRCNKEFLRTDQFILNWCS